MNHGTFSIGANYPGPCVVMVGTKPCGVLLKDHAPIARTSHIFRGKAS